MASLTGNIQFEGSLSGFSAYRMRGTDKIIFRSKGGPSKKMVKTDAKFANTRRNNSEWSACTMSTKGIRMALSPIHLLADYNFTGSLNAIAKLIQKQDQTSSWGQREVIISENKNMLEGFNLNRNLLFDSVFRCGYSYTIDRSNLAATLNFSEIWPHLHLHNPNKHTLFRINTILGIISDIRYDEAKALFTPETTREFGFTHFRSTDWHSVNDPIESKTINLNIENKKPLLECESLVLSIGIEFGRPLSNNAIEAIKYSGSAKILNVK